MGVGSSVEPGVALGVQQELPVPVVVVVVVAAVGLERASEWLLRVAHLAHSTDALVLSRTSLLSGPRWDRRPARLAAGGAASSAPMIACMRALRSSTSRRCGVAIHEGLREGLRVQRRVPRKLAAAVACAAPAGERARCGVRAVRPGNARCGVDQHREPSFECRCAAVQIGEDKCCRMPIKIKLVVRAVRTPNRNGVSCSESAPI